MGPMYIETPNIIPNSRKFGVVAIEKGAFGLPSSMVGLLYVSNAALLLLNQKL